MQEVLFSKSKLVNHLDDVTQCCHDVSENLVTLLAKAEDYIVPDSVISDCGVKLKGR